MLHGGCKNFLSYECFLVVVSFYENNIGFTTMLSWPSSFMGELPDLKQVSLGDFTDGKPQYTQIFSKCW